MRSDHHLRRSRSVVRVAIASMLASSVAFTASSASASFGAGALARGSSAPAAPPPCPSGLGAGGEYHPLAPQRIYDSRPTSAVNETSPGAKAATPSQPTFDIGLIGLGGVPGVSADVLAVVVNITVTEPTAGGWLNAYGSGAPAGLASIVNFSTQQTVPNLSIVRPGDNGRLTVKLFTQSAAGSAHVVVDVFGWFSTSCAATRGARLVTLAPGRLLDTRTDAGRAELGQGESIELNIRGAALPSGGTIPTDVTGVVLNVTAINDLPGSRATFVSVVPDPPAGGAPPSTSNLNLARGQIKPNMVIVPVGADGKIRLYNNSGTVDLAVDVAGYLQRKLDETRAGRVVPLTTPYRVFDTRESQWGAVALGPGQAEDWSFADFVGSVNIGGVAVGNQFAVIGNLTSASLTRQYPTVAANSYLTVYPSDTTRPNASNLNIVEGAPVPNLAIMKYSATTTVRVFNLAGYNHYLYDASAVVLAD